MKKRILVVDDEAGITNGLRLNLEATGLYEVREENRSANAVATAHEFRPDLIVIDVIMPEPDGPDVVARFGDDELLRRTPVVFLTGLATSDEARQGWVFTSGGRTFMPKPPHVDRLIECIENLTAAPAAVAGVRAEAAH